MVGLVLPPILPGMDLEEEEEAMGVGAEMAEGVEMGEVEEKALSEVSEV